MKKMRKYYLILVLSLVMLFSLSGCERIINNEIYNKSYNVNINLEEFEDLVSAAIEKAAPAVIGVSNYEKSLIGTYSLSSTGSGVVYECAANMKDGTIEDDCTKTLNSSNEIESYTYYAITNRHVIEGKNAKIRVYLDEENTKIDAYVLGYDDKIDISVIKFNHTNYIQPITFADSEALKRGNFAIAIGNPNGYDYYGSATFGIISYPKRYMSDDTDGDGINDWDAEYIQHDVAINPGNSGGALINIKGELIGINTLKLVSDDIDNMGFAIPSNLVKELIEVLENGETPKRYTLGISVYEVSTLLNKEDYANGTVPDIEIPESIKYGLYVNEVDVNGKAYGRIQTGDFILEFNGVKILGSKEFRAELGKVLEGETAILKVYRNGIEIEVKIVFN